MSSNRKKILITYAYFLPAYKAGGPIQSIANLCRQLKDEFQFYVICNDRDHNETQILKGIKSNQWNDFENGTASVHYVSKGNLKKSYLLKTIKEVKPDILFINGIFSPYFNLIPLLYSNCKKIMSARGMLHGGALTQKSFKKNIYISLLKLLGVGKKVTFHATDKDEMQFIKKVFGNNTTAVVAQNFSNINFSSETINKNIGELKLVSIALISPMKNHLLVLQALKNLKENIAYDVYGPVKDVEYWNSCIEIIKTLPQNISVNYKGSIEPCRVNEVLSQYHYFILPSKSENFGHAIFEALTAGKPVITSYNTPWKNLEANSAGYNVDIENVNTISEAVESACMQSNNVYQHWSLKSSEFASKSIDVEAIKDQYRQLFN